VTCSEKLDRVKLIGFLGELVDEDEYGIVEGIKNGKLSLVDTRKRAIGHAAATSLIWPSSNPEMSAYSKCSPYDLSNLDTAAMQWCERPFKDILFRDGQYRLVLDRTGHRYTTRVSKLAPIRRNMSQLPSNVLIVSSRRAGKCSEITGMWLVAGCTKSLSKMCRRLP